MALRTQFWESPGICWPCLGKASAQAALEEQGAFAEQVAKPNPAAHLNGFELRGGLKLSVNRAMRTKPTNITTLFIPVRLQALGVAAGWLSASPTSTLAAATAETLRHALGRVSVVANPFG